MDIKRIVRKILCSFISKTYMGLQNIHGLETEIKIKTFSLISLNFESVATSHLLHPQRDDGPGNLLYQGSLFAKGRKMNI